MFLNRPFRKKTLEHRKLSQAWKEVQLNDINREITRLEDETREHEQRRERAEEEIRKLEAGFHITEEEDN